MIKKYRSVVKAEIFDGSKEMVSRYPIRYFPESDWLGEHWVLDIQTPSGAYPVNLFIGQYLVTRSDNRVISMDPYDFEKLFPEVIDD